MLINNDQTFILLQKCLDASAMRQKLISNNIANAGTPGFKASDINFKEQVKKVLQKKNIPNQKNYLTCSEQNHITSGANSFSELTPIIIKKDSYKTSDGNNVDIDREMATLATNSIEFRSYIRAMGDMMSIISIAIKEE